MPNSHFEPGKTNELTKMLMGDPPYGYLAYADIVKERDRGYERRRQGFDAVKEGFRWERLQRQEERPVPRRHRAWSRRDA